MLNLYRCKHDHQIIKEECKRKSCSWWVYSTKFLNCTWVACSFGPFTPEEVGEMLGVSRERIGQIEAVALENFRKAAARTSILEIIKEIQEEA